MKEYNIISEIFGLSTAQNEIFEISSNLISLIDIRRKIETNKEKEPKDEDWGFTEDDFPLKIVTLEIDKDFGIIIQESAIFN